MKGFTPLVLGILATLAFSWLGLAYIPDLQIGHLDPQSDEEGTDIYPMPKSGMAERGRRIYIANGCFYCHSEQVRADYAASDIDRKWGDRRSAPRDYIFDRPALLGKMRLGPDLANIGKRAPAEEEATPAQPSPANPANPATPNASPPAANASPPPANAQQNATPAAQPSTPPAPNASPPVANASPPPTNAQPAAQPSTPPAPNAAPPAANASPPPGDAQQNAQPAAQPPSTPPAPAAPPPPANASTSPANAQQNAKPPAQPPTAPAGSPSQAAAAPSPAASPSESPALYSAAWHHLQLYSPRSLNLDSDMPAFKFLYEKRRVGGEQSADAIILRGEGAPGEGWEIVPTYDAKCIVAYLMSLNQSHPLNEVKSAAPPVASPAAAKSPAK
jgi:cbb3-type cytochrome oxidase cytochrome c subunit